MTQVLATADGRWLNALALGPRSRRHVESYFVRANDPTRRRALWLKLTAFAEGSAASQRRAEAWAIVFDGDTHGHLGVKQTWPIDALQYNGDLGVLGLGPCSLDAGGTYGLVRQGDLTLVWDLAFHDEQGPYAPLPAPWLYGSPLVSSKTVTPHPCARLTGTLEIWRGRGAGRSARTCVSLSGWYGAQGHNWGRRHAERYVWSHCSLFRERAAGTYFEAFAGEVRLGPWLSPPVVLGRLVTPDGTYRFDRWSSPVGAHTEHTPTSWRFVLRGRDGVLRGRVDGALEDTVGLHYANPAGPVTYCLNSKLARLHLELQTRTHSETLTSDAAALEVGTHDAGHGVRMLL